jgi:hypothetical protein
MKKILIILLVLISVLLIIPSAHAQNHAECDECGYCVGRDAPDDWKQCKECLYENTSDDPKSNQTLDIKQNSKTGRFEQITKTPGSYYTQLGCLNTGADSFSNPTAPGGVLNFLLSKLIFPTVGILSFISLLYGAFLLMTAQGSTEQVGKGKSYIVGAIVGLIFTLSAVLIINILAGDILRIPGFSRAPEAEVQAIGSVATVNGKIAKPILSVSYEGKELQTKEINSGSQQVSVSLPISKDDLNKLEVLQNITFSMKNDNCYTITNGDRALCCDCIVDQSQMSVTKKNKCNEHPLSSTRIAQCNDRTNYNGDVNLTISQIVINGKKCTALKENGVLTSTIHFSGVDGSATCAAIES